MERTEGARLNLICSAFILLTLGTSWPGAGYASQQIGFGFEPSLYQVGSVAGQDGWVDVYSHGYVSSPGAAEGTQYLALQENWGGTGRVERGIGANVTQSTVVFSYDLFLPAGWLTGYNTCNSTFGALAQFSVNGASNDYLAFGVGKAGGSLSSFHGVSGEGIFVDGNLGGGYRSALYSNYWMSVSSLLNSWHNLRLEISAQDGHGLLFLDNKLILTVDFGAPLSSVDRVAFEQDRYGACDCIQRWVQFDGPPSQAPEPGSLVMLLAGCGALAVKARRGRAPARS